VLGGAVQSVFRYRGAGMAGQMPAGGQDKGWRTRDRLSDADGSR
jgi:hypothetical protein